MTVRQQRSSKDIPEVSGAPEEWDRTLNELINDHNFLSKNLSFQSNFNGQIIENVKFAAGETLTIQHKLGILPRYRIILRQEGNGVLEDIPSGWNNFQIQMKNNGAVSVTATIMLVRE